MTKWEDPRGRNIPKLQGVTDSPYFDRKTCFDLQIHFYQMCYKNLNSFILGFYISVYVIGESEGSCDLECKRLSKYLC